jgi:hypothetical protein
MPLRCAGARECRSSFLVLLLMCILSVLIAEGDGEGEEEWAFVKQCKHGKFLLNKHDTDISKVLAETGEWEEQPLQILLSIVREGDTVIDAGANVGAMTVPLAKRVGPTGRVHAFEPQVGVRLTCVCMCIYVYVSACLCVPLSLSLSISISHPLTHTLSLSLCPPLPQRVVNQQLNGNVALNSLMNVDVYLAALGNETGHVMVPSVNYLIPGILGGLIGVVVLREGV